MANVLVLTSSPVATLQELKTLLESQGLGAAEPAVATSSGNVAAGTLAAAAYDTIVSVASSQGHHSLPLLGQLVAALKPGGRLVVQEVSKAERREPTLCKLTRTLHMHSIGLCPITLPRLEYRQPGLQATVWLVMPHCTGFSGPSPLLSLCVAARHSCNQLSILCRHLDALQSVACTHACLPPASRCLLAARHQ